MSELFAVPSRRQELSDLAFGAAILLLAVPSVFGVPSMNMIHFLATGGGVVVAIMLLFRGFRARNRRLAKSQEVQRLQKAMLNAVDF